MSISVKALVLGGGGAGSYNCAGGGGGGGVVYNGNLILAETSYTITIGAGGAGTPHIYNYSGNQSTLGSLITAGGGGRGGGYFNEGAADSGTKATGGGNYGNGYLANGSGQGYAGGNGSAAFGGNAGGGGGGAGSVGGNYNNATHTAGIGGAGFSSDITGTVIKYGGGGGGGGYTGTGQYGATGTDGGGNGGSSPNENGTNGTANRGGGGGGAAAGGGGTGGSGGSGIIIISYLSSVATGTGGTKTTSGNYTIHTFTTSGTFAYTILNPIIDTINPPAASIAGGQTIIIKGSRFAAGILVYFGTAEATDITVNDDETITCTAPELIAGLYDITATNTNNGTVTSIDAYGAAEYNINPTTGGLHGINITISGDYFIDGMTGEIDGAALSNLIVVDEKTITAKTPTHGAETGLIIYLLYPDSSELIPVGFFSYSGEPYSDSEPIFEKNRLSSAGAVISLLEVTIPGIEGEIRLARNTADITWGGKTWRAFPFVLGSINANSNNEIPELQVQISNITREIQAALEESDGAAGTKIKVILIHTAHESALWQATYAVKHTTCDAQWATFTCGLEYPSTSRRPIESFQKYICRFQYGDFRCSVADATKTTYPTCGKNITDCKVRSNSARFGGELNIPGNYFG